MEKAESVLQRLGIPPEFGVALLIFGFVLTVAPYLSNADFGVLKIPAFRPTTRRNLRITGPIALVAVIFLHVPFVRNQPVQPPNSPPQSATKEESTPPTARKPLRERLDTLFGEGNWFVYPNNTNQLGVIRVPAGLRVEEPIHRIDTAVGDFRLGDEVPEDVGANVRLRQPIRPSDIPPWQLGPLKKWQAEKAQDGHGITRARVNEIFGNTTWRRNSGHESSAIGTLTRNLTLAYPIVSVDSDDGKFGVGLPDISAGKSVTIWFAERIGEDL